MTPMDDRNFDVFFKIHGNDVTLLRGAPLKTAMETARLAANQRRTTVIVLNRLDGTHHVVSPQT